nr:MAG TPA: hypothetical protein [Caudoviricetes sp.]
MNNENKKIEVSESNLKAAFEVADESTKKVLVALFGNIEPTDDNKLSLKDYKSIRSYEDACKALGESVDEETLKKAGVPKHIIAQMKLELICKALWGGEVKVYPDPDGNRIYWYPWFALYNQSEIDGMSDKERGCLLSATAVGGATAGFGSLNATVRSSYSPANSGFRLCLDTEEKAEYFGKQFLELWAEAIAFNFSVGERLK